MEVRRVIPNFSESNAELSDVEDFGFMVNYYLTLNAD